MSNRGNKPIFDAFEAHTKRFERDFTSKDILPRMQNWRPHRFCVRDVILALVATRFNSRLGITEVDLFATYDPEIFEDYSGTRIAISFVLSDSFMSGSSMEIRFTRNFGKETVPVPGSLFGLAVDLGVRLEYAKQGTITSSEAKQLYFALTNLSETARSRMAMLHNQDLVSVERVCFMVNSQTWQSE